jgi:hypothetical protein
MKILISLMGEQIIPNLLPSLYLKPDTTVLVYTDRTEPVMERLLPLLENPAPPLKVPAFEISEVQGALSQFISKQGWDEQDVIFNLTGGTKPMVLAAHQVARQLRSPFVYLQSEGGQSLLYHHAFANEGRLKSTKERLPTLVNLDIYLRAHLGAYTAQSPRTISEEVVHDVIRPVVDECKTSVQCGALEIDLVMRCGNQVGIAEVKSGKSANKKEGIDQLTTAGAQRYLGTYTRRFLIVDRKIRSNNRALAEAHRIHIIEIPGIAEGKLSETEMATLMQTVLDALGVKNTTSSRQPGDYVNKS